MTSDPILQTERTWFRPFVESDLPLLIQQRSDPEVNRYLGGTRMQNPEALTKRIQFYISCVENFGFGMCPMFLKETGEMIGTAGLQPLIDTDDIEVGYSLVKAQWGKGLGTEAAIGWMNFGFTKKGLERIVAVANVDNAASRHIMEKIGMTFEKNDLHYDEECAFYSISKNEFFRINGAL